MLEFSLGGSSYTLTSTWLVWKPPSTSGGTIGWNPTLMVFPSLCEIDLYFQGCSLTSNILAANNGWQIQMFLLVVLIRITATCPALGVT